jgi:signal transduction histidine kinase
MISWKNRIISLLTSGKFTAMRDQRDMNEIVRLIVLNIVYGYASVMILGLGIQDMQRGLVNQGLLQVIIGFMIFVNISLLRTELPYTAGALILTSIFGIFCGMSIFAKNDTQGFSSVWIFSYPLMSVFTLGLPLGLFPALILFAAALTGTLAPNLAQFDYTTGEAFLICGVYFFVMILAIVYETVRSMKDKWLSRQDSYMNMVFANSPDIIILTDRDGGMIYCAHVFLLRAGIGNFDSIRKQHYRTVFSRFMDGKKLDRLTLEQCRELLTSAAGEINRFEAVLESISAGILVCDEKHGILMANKSARRLLPLSFSEGSLLWESVLDDRITDFFRQTMLSSDKVLDREMDIDLQGQSRLLSISVLPLVRDRRITGSLVYIEDITEKRSRESRLRRAENLASLTTLAAGVAHEIKNPLGSISIHLQLMQKALAKSRPAKKEAVQTLLEKYINILNEEVDRLNRIVVDFLFAVRPMTLELREGDINTLLGELAEFVRPEMEQGKVRLLLELDKNLPPLLMDERLMKQALLNLIKNAQAAMPEGGLLTIATLPVDNNIRISICDTGTGISEENLAKIFEPYFTTKENGTGLGLTLVFRIIKEHQGEISVDSREGEGTDFEITLPTHQKEHRMLTYRGDSGSKGGKICN